MICVAIMVGDVATLVGNLLQVMPRYLGALIVIAVINVLRIGVRDFQNLPNPFWARVGIWWRTALVRGGVEIGILDRSDIPSGGVVIQIRRVPVEISIALQELLRRRAANAWTVPLLGRRPDQGQCSVIKGSTGTVSAGLGINR